MKKRAMVMAVAAMMRGDQCGSIWREAGIPGWYSNCICNG